MPLAHGTSEAVKSRNIREMISAGHPKDVAVAAALRVARETKAEGGPVLRPKTLTSDIRGPEGFAYHATNKERLHDIRDDGALKVHKPHEFTDQSVWPDGSREKRSYFLPDPGSTWNFAPEEGTPVVLRTPLGPHIQKERGTGDLYATKPIPTSDLEYLHESGEWHPMSREERAAGGAFHIRRPHLGARIKLHVGPIHAHVAGRTDHLPMVVPHGSYVVPADVVSAHGEGNTIAGFKVLRRAFGGLPYSGGSAPYGVAGGPYGEKLAEGGRADDHGEGVPIVAAGGEYVISPDEVRRVGDGDLDLGHRVLDEFVKRARAETVSTLKKLPGPAKS